MVPNKPTKRAIVPVTNLADPEMGGSDWSPFVESLKSNTNKILFT